MTWSLTTCILEAPRSLSPLGLLPRALPSSLSLFLLLFSLCFSSDLSLEDLSSLRPVQIPNCRGSSAGYTSLPITQSWHHPKLKQGMLLYLSLLHNCKLLFFVIFNFFMSFRATLSAYGGSQARGRIRAVAAGLHHSHRNARSKLHLRPTPQLTATPGP